MKMANGLSIQVSNDQLVMETSTIVVSYNHLQQLTVTVSDSVADKVCGACGKITAAEKLLVSLKSNTVEWTPLHLTTW